MVRASCLTVPAADAFGIVGRFCNVNTHAACVAARTAVGTLALINAVSIERYAVEKGVDRTEGADIFTERAVDHDGEYDGYRKDRELQHGYGTCFRPGRDARTRYASDGHKRDTAQEHTGRTDVLAEEGILRIKQRKDDYKYYKNDVFEVPQRLVTREGSYLELFGQGDLIEQILNQTEGTQETADESAADGPEEHDEADDIEREPITGWHDGIAAVCIIPELAGIAVVEYRLQ